MIPDLLYVAVVIGLVLLLAILLDRLLLQPVTRVMKAREGAIGSARDLADTSRARAQAALEDFDAKTRAARADVYGQMDEKRRAAQATRAEIVADTRREVERLMGEATGRLQAQAVAARAQLDSEADALANTIAERVLGRKAS